MDIKQDAFRFAIKNAFEHNGNASTQAVVGKIMALHKEIDLKKAMPQIIEAVNSVNSMDFSEIEKEFRKLEKTFEVKQAIEKKQGLPELDWAGKERVVTRFAPNPNGPMHFGHARAVILSFETARKYDGEFILRFEDTDPKIKKPLKNAEEVFRKDLEWLDIKVEKVFFASDRLETYYDFMRKLLEMEKAYVCSCKPEKWRKIVLEKKACPCRKQGSRETLSLFDKMLAHEIKEGQAVLRIKTDLKHPDPSVRDWWAARIVDNPEHPRTGSKYHLWPSYMFQSAIDDHLMEVTLILRGQEHEQNETKQRFLFGYFGWKYPHTIHFGRLSLGKMVLSTSKILAGIEKGDYDSWDDPRVGTLAALRKRGFQPETIREIILTVGAKTNDAKIEEKKLADTNKKFVEQKADRIPFVLEPFELEVNFAEQTVAEIDGKEYILHRGIQKFLVDRKELEMHKNAKLVRMRNAYNARIEKISEFGATAKYSGREILKAPIISWVTDGTDIEIVSPQNKKIIATADARILEKKEGDIVYLEKYGFARIDSMQGKRPVLYFCHE